MLSKSAAVWIAALVASSEKFSFHFVLFPTASLVFREEFNVIAVVTRIASVEPRVVSLLAYPSLTGDYGRVAVVTLFGGITDHFSSPGFTSLKEVNMQSLYQ
jgi:hypothetical protein